jgi:hypothetical protein
VSLSIVFDSEREMTLKEMILVQRVTKNDWEAFIDLVQLRAVGEPPARADLEALPMSEVNRLCQDLAVVIKRASEAAAAIKLH